MEGGILWMKIPLDYSYAELDIQEKQFKTLRNTLQVVSFLVFLPEKHPWCVLHTCTHPMMSSLQTQCHLVVGHTLMHTLSKVEVNRTDHSWDIDIFVSPLLFLFWPLSAPDHPAPETWPQNQHHNNSSPSLPRPHQMPSLVCWQLGWHPSACPSMTGTLKMPITPSPYFAIPWRTGSSSTTFCQTARTTSGMSLQPWEPNP